MVRTEDAIYSAEQSVRQLIRSAEQVENPSVEILNSQITLESIARFSGSHAVSHASNYAQRLGARENVEISAKAMTQQRAKKTKYAATCNRKEILFNPFAEEIDQLLVIHEVAHAVNGNNKHDNSFIDTYTALVEKYIGHGVAFVLRFEIDTAKNKFRTAH